LSPIVTAGLPAPGPLDAAVEAVLDELLELLDDELLLPQAASPSATAPMLSTATMLRPTPTELRERLSGISRLHMYCLLAIDCRDIVHFLDLNKNKYHSRACRAD
jgi:hypothetical protein